MAVCDHCGNDGGLDDVCGLLTHQAAQLSSNRVLRSIPPERKPGDGDHNQQDRCDRGHRIKCDCSSTAQRLIIDEREDRFFQHFPGCGRHSCLRIVYLPPLRVGKLSLGVGPEGGGLRGATSAESIGFCRFAQSSLTGNAERRDDCDAGGTQKIFVARLLISVGFLKGTRPFIRDGGRARRGPLGCRH
jgi:hypothetical protein